MKIIHMFLTTLLKSVLFLLFCYMLHNEQSAPHRFQTLNLVPKALFLKSDGLFVGNCCVCFLSKRRKSYARVDAKHTIIFKRPKTLITKFNSFLQYLICLSTTKYRKSTSPKHLKK